MISTRPSTCVVRCSFSTFLFWATWAVLVATHWRFCYPAMISRAAAALTPGDLCQMFIAPGLVAVPAIFGNRRLRSTGMLVGGVGFAIAYAIVATNLSSTRPHTGHLVGVVGILQVDSLSVAVFTLLCWAPVALAIHFFERVTGDTLRRCMFGGSDPPRPCDRLPTADR